MKNKNQKLMIAFLAFILFAVIINAAFQIIRFAVVKTALFIGDPVIQYPTAEIRVPRKATTTIKEISAKVKGVIREITAYNSLPFQTDSSPCIGAGGEICKRYQKGECIVASNSYPLGTKLKIDKVGICTVADKMNKRFTNRIDLFMDKDIERAVKFGVQRLEVVKL